MSTLSLRKIKHDSSSIDNITLNSNGTTSTGSELTVPSLKGASGNKLQLRSGDSSFGVSLQNVSGIDLLAIDGVGRVKMPYQPFFSGHRNSGNVSAVNVVVHNVIDINNGNYYNTTNGRFTCPITGIYEVHMCGHAEASQPTQLRIAVNGTSVKQEYQNGAGYGTTPVTAILNCNANDYIESIVQTGTYWGGDISGLRMTVKLIG